MSSSRKFGYTDDLDHELGSIRSAIRSCEDKIEEVDEELSDTERTVARLVQQVRRLEGQLMAADGAQHADLGNFTKDQHDLARSMERGRQARSLLLSDHERSTYRHRLRYHRESAEKLRAHRTTVIDTVDAAPLHAVRLPCPRRGRQQAP
ncbi:hypothetical protein ACWDZ8_35955 [Streptomyces sp. NPDC003233]